MREWINVWDKQPEKGVKVLISLDKDLHIAECISYNDGQEHIYFHGIDDGPIYEAQWWMPLPQPKDEV